MSKILIGRGDTDLDYPICRPSLDLDFTQEELDPRITFTRGSIGTRVNRNRLIETVAANQPRFDYDPVTGECKGLLIEESRTNLFLYSDSPNLAYYDPAITDFSVNSIISPDGTQNADKVLALSGKSFAQISQGVTITSGATLTGSVYIKYGGFNRVEIVMLSNNNTTPYARATFDPTIGTITTAVSTANGGTNASANIVFVGNGWYRCNVTVTYPAVTLAGMRINATSFSAGISEGSLGVYVWGMQIEAGAFPTSYIPTTASTVTRSADLASMTGTNFSSWFNQTEGTLYANLNNITSRSSLTFDRLVALTGSDVNRNVISITTQTAAGGGAQDGFIPGVSYSPDGSYVVDVPLSVVSGVGPRRIGKAILAYQRNNFGFTVNGAKPTFAGKGEVAVCDRLLIFGQARFQPAPSGYIKRLTYYPRALKPNQLQLLTQ